MDTPAVQFCSVRIANMNQQQRHYLAETVRPQPWHWSVGRTSMNARRSSWLCLSQQSKDQWRLETNKHCTASSISKPSSASVTVPQILFILPPNITCLSQVLPHHRSCLSMWVCLRRHHSTNQPESAEVARNYSTSPEVFWCISLWILNKWSYTI